MQWWQDFFDDAYADIMLERDEPEELDNLAQFLLDILHLKPNQTVFDQCCGIGNVSNSLAKKGLNVVGVDQSEPYIARAKKDQPREGLVSYVLGDALHYTTPMLCDGAYNWYTSFGYFDKDEQNIKMLECVYKSLKAGAHFILDYTNPFYILQNFQESTVIRKNINDQEWLLLKEASIDVLRQMFVSKWTLVSTEGKSTTKIGESKIYFPHDFKKMFRQCGFENIQFLGDRQGSPFTKNSPRCLVLANKSA